MTLWDRPARLALLELVLTGALRRRERQAVVFDHLESLPWTGRSPRSKEIVVREQGRRPLEELLDRVWPEWQQVAEQLKEAGLPPTMEGLDLLEQHGRKSALRDLPPRLHHRTAMALIGAHSKVVMTGERRAAVDTTLTHDGVLRIRPPRGMTLVVGATRLEVDVLMQLLGELVLPERALLDGLTLDGSIPRAVLTVENLGTYLDLTAPEGWMVIHVPGWDTHTLRALLPRLGSIPLVHYGDLDPDGLGIVAHLRTLRPELHWFVPDWWGERINIDSLPRSWPADLDLSQAPMLVQTLAQRGLWLEQEPITLDPRLRASLEALLE